MGPIQAQLGGDFPHYVTERRNQRRDDMMTDLLQADFEDETGERRRLSEIELVAFIGRAVPMDMPGEGCS